MTYARKVIVLRDKQVDFLNTLTLERRIKQKVKKVIPNKLLTLLGFTPYAPLVIPTQEFSDVPAPSVQEEIVPTYKYQTPNFDDTIKNTISNFQHRPVISIIMPVYNVAPQWLDKALKSVEAQWYQKWELCIADDKSTNPQTIEYLKNINHPHVKVTFLEKNLNISGASNAALSLATGEYIALLDNDDELTPDALYEMVKVINKTDADFIYRCIILLSKKYFHLFSYHRVMVKYTCFKSIFE